MSYVENAGQDLSRRRPRMTRMHNLSASVLCLLVASSALSEELTSGSTDPESELEASALDLIVVTGEADISGIVAETSVVGMKTDTPILETPQSVSVVTRDQIEIQNPGTTSSALRYTAGATSEAYGAFGNYFDITRIRGIQADYYLDGLRIVSNPGSWLPQIDPYALDRVEVLRGPSSVLYGQGTGGGIVNQVSRRPQEDASHEIRLEGGNFARKHVGIDSTGPLNDDRSLLYRLTLSGLDTDEQVEDTKHRRLYLAPSVTLRPDDSTTWTIAGTYSNEPTLPDYISLPATFLGLGDSRFRPLDTGRNYTDTSYSDSSREQAWIGSYFEREFGSGWRFTSNSRYMHVNSNIKRGSVYGFTEVEGTPLLKGYYEDSPAEFGTFSTDNYISGDASHGAFRHKALIGFDYTRGNINNALYSVGPIFFDPYSSEYRPSIVPDYTESRSAPWKLGRNFRRGGVYIQDQLSWGDWFLTIGGRHDWFSSDDETYSYSATPRRVKYEDSAWSGRIGLSYQFGTGFAPYVSYSTSYDPLLETDWQGNAFRPVDSRQAEIGIKYSPEGSNALVTAAIFDLLQANVKTPDALHLGFNTQAGEVRTRGMDLQVSMEIAPSTNIIAGYTYLDNEVLQDTRYKGKSLTQVPAHSASAWLDYRFDEGVFEGLRVGGGVRYLGSTYGDPTNSFKVPATTLVDFALSYDVGQMSPKLAGTKFNLNVNNIFDTKYVSSCTSQLYCFVGEWQTVTASLSYRW